MKIALLTKEDFISILNNVFDTRDEKLLKKFKKELLPEKKISIEEASNQFGVTPLTIRNWIANGNLKAKKIGHRVYILQSDIDSALQEVKSLKYRRSK